MCLIFVPQLRYVIVEHNKEVDCLFDIILSIVVDLIFSFHCISSRLAGLSVCCVIYFFNHMGNISLFQ